MSLITGTTIEYEMKNPAEVTSAYSYAKFINCWNKYELGVDGNPVIQWVSPNQRINVTIGDSSNYVDIIWIYDEFNTYTDASVLIPASSASELPVITKLDIQTYKLVIDDIVIDKATPTGNAFDTQTKPTSYNLQTNEYVLSMSYYFTERETVENPSILDKIRPVLRVNIEGETWYFLPPLFRQLYIRNIPNSGNKLDATNPYGTNQPHSGTDTLMFNPTGTTFAVTYPSLGHSFYCGGDIDYAIIFDNVNNSTNLLKTEAASIDVVLRTIATMGCYFEYNGVTYLGFMDDSGQTTGEYLTEENWEKSAQWDSDNINNFSEHNPPYVPPIPIDDDSYADMGIGVGTGVGGYTTFSLMTMDDLVDLLADFNANLQTGMSVVNNFICLYKLGPLSSYLCSTRVGNIIMSANASTNFVSVRADYNVVTSQKNVITLGSYNVPRMTNTFYDFAPYSTYELFIPCCGWVPLPDTVAGRQIVVYLIIDLASCTCKGVCRIDGTTVAEASGVLGVSVPFFATDSGIKRAADLMAVTQMISGIAQGAVGAGSGAGALVVSGSANALQGLEQLYINGNTNYTAIKGGNGDITAVGNGEYCTVKITHPVVDEVVNNSRFGHSVGYLCNTVGKIKEFKGLTVCANPHVTGIDCTESEKEEIKRLLEEGIIVN